MLFWCMRLCSLDFKNLLNVLPLLYLTEITGPWVSSSLPSSQEDLGHGARGSLLVEWLGITRTWSPDSPQAALPNCKPPTITKRPHGCWTNLCKNQI